MLNVPDREGEMPYSIARSEVPASGRGPGWQSLKQESHTLLGLEGQKLFALEEAVDGPSFVNEGECL